MSASHRQPPTVAIIGAGRAGGTLAVLLAEAGWTVTALWSRRKGRARTVAGWIRRRTGQNPACCMSPLAVMRRRPGLVILALPDHALSPMAVQLAASHLEMAGTVVLHLSGACNVNVLSPLLRHTAGTGSLHPLSVLTHAAPESGSLRGAGFAVAGDPPAYRLARRIVQDLEGHPLVIADRQRPAYHLGASLVANDSLALVHLAVAELQRAGLSEAQARRSLAHLLGASARSIATGPVADVLTGPVARGDVETLAEHLEVAPQRTADLHRLLSQVLLQLVETGGRVDPVTVRRLRRLLAGTGSPTR